MSFAVFSFKFNSKKTKRVCSDCHQRKGYLDFAALGVQPQRVAHLNSSEVVGLIDKYKTFYMPSEIDFGAGKDFQ